MTTMTTPNRKQGRRTRKGNPLTFMLNWQATAYHAPVIVGQHLGYYTDEGIDLAIVQPLNPSDVTRIVGYDHISIGLKAMIHTIAGRARGHDFKSIGTLLDEPPTGLIFLESSGIKTFDDIRGKKLGFIGEFGKYIIDDLAKAAGIDESEYETVRVGMHMVDAIMSGTIDAGIGFSNVHQIELETRSGSPAGILRIDELAALGCCCFCSIQIIAHDNIITQNPELLKRFLRATQRASTFVTQYPDDAYRVLCEALPNMNNAMQAKIFKYTLPYFSRGLHNVDRDWLKVHGYTHRLDIHDGDLPLSDIYTNDYIPFDIHTETPAVVEQQV